MSIRWFACWLFLKPALMHTSQHSQNNTWQSRVLFRNPYGYKRGSFIFSIVKYLIPYVIVFKQPKYLPSSLLGPKKIYLKKNKTANTSANIPCQISKPMVKPNRSTTKFLYHILSLGYGMNDLSP